MQIPICDKREPITVRFSSQLLKVLDRLSNQTGYSRTFVLHACVYHLILTSFFDSMKGRRKATKWLQAVEDTQTFYLRRLAELEGEYE